MSTAIMPATDLTLASSVETPAKNAEETSAETRAARLPPALRPYCFQPGNKGGGRPKGRLSAWRMIGEMVEKHPEYKSSIRTLLQASNISTQLVAEALIRRVEDKDWRPQLRAVELIARITGELKDTQIIQQQAVSVEDGEKLRKVAEALLAARPVNTVAATVEPTTPARPATTVPVTDAEPMMNQQTGVQNVQAVVQAFNESQTPTPAK